MTKMTMMAKMMMKKRTLMENNLLKKELMAVNKVLLADAKKRSLLASFGNKKRMTR